MPASVNVEAFLDTLADYFGVATETINGNIGFNPMCCDISSIEIYQDANTTGPGYWTFVIYNDWGLPIKIRFTAP